MELLITGRLSSLSASFCDRMSEKHKLLLSSTDIDNAVIGKAATPYKIAPHDAGFEKLFHSHTFGAAIFFSQRPEENKDYFDELQDLECVLRYCSEHGVEKVIYVSSTSVYAGMSMVDEHTESMPLNGIGVVISACERLCDFYREQKGMSIVTLHTPSTYGYGEKSSFVGRIISEAVDQASLRFDGTENQICDFLSETDLAELMIRMLDDWSLNEVINVPGGCALSLVKLGEEMKNAVPTLRVSFSGRPMAIAAPISSDISRNRYDWIPVHSLSDELPEIIEEYKKVTGKKKGSFFAPVTAFMEKHAFIIRFIELVIGFLIMELLNRYTGTTSTFRFVDFRLLYVMLLGILHGLSTGIAAAFLACVSCFIGYLQVGYKWPIIIYGIENWLPFACYMIIGSITGYIKDRYRNELNFEKEERRLLEERYIFLNELYANAIENKGIYKNQIMSYRDSFGRIFEVTKKLNTVLSDAVFKEALAAMEDILENQSICIYTVDKFVSFGRLMVCSKKISNITTKSVQLSNYGLMVSEFKEGEVWSNTSRLLGYPEYAAPIYSNGEIVALITIQNVKYEQMAMYYENLIKVLCGLLQVSLFRAIEYNEMMEEKIYLPGSHIMRKDYFMKILMLKEEMEVSSVSEYSLLHINCNKENMVELSNIISSQLRTTDILGEGENGELYLILSQTSDATLGFALKRLKNVGIVFQQFDGLGE